MSSTKQTVTALIYDKRGRVLAIGKNSYVKTHPLQAKYATLVGLDHKIYLHAEIDAITKCRDLDLAHRMLVTRYGAHGAPRNAKPCPICQAALEHHTNIRHVEYTI